MFVCCEPCPVKRNASRGGLLSVPDVLGDSCLDAILARTSRASSSDSATTLVRTAKWVRPAAAVCATSPRSIEGFSARCRSYRAANWAIASGELADKRDQLDRAMRSRRSGQRAGRLFQQNVRVGSAHSERTHAREPSSVAALPGHRFQRHGDGELVPGNPGVGRTKVRLGRNGLMLERQYDLDQSRNPGRGLEVADVRFYRADPEPVIPRAVPSIGFCQAIPPQSDLPAAYPSHGFRRSERLRSDARPVQRLARAVVAEPLRWAR